MSLLFSNLSRILVRPVVSSVGIHQPSYLMTALRFKGGVKTVSGVKKRFRLRGSGSIKRRRSGTSHNTGYKQRQRSNRLGCSTGIEGKKMEQRVRKMLGCF